MEDPAEYIMIIAPCVSLSRDDVWELPQHRLQNGFTLHWRHLPNNSLQFRVQRHQAFGQTATKESDKRSKLLQLLAASPSAQERSICTAPLAA